MPEAALRVATQEDSILAVRGLVTEFIAGGRWVRAVDGVSFEIQPGEAVALVGESGSGKSATALSILGLLPKRSARIADGEILFGKQDLVRASPKAMRKVRGKSIAMVFQDPTSSLTPVLRIGTQLTEAIAAHQPGGSRSARRRRAVELLELVGIPNAKARLNQYPYEFSGGMRQRVMIAMAIANDPDVLIADEPTTALDVTVQAQMMELLKTLQETTNAALLMITHDLGLAADFVDRMYVMYAGRIIEHALTSEVFGRPRHPYTVGLMASLPHLEVRLNRLPQIPGQPAHAGNIPPGCAFHPRCPLGRGRQVCQSKVPPLELVEPRHASACHFAAEVDSAFGLDVGSELSRGTAEDER